MRNEITLKDWCEGKTPDRNDLFGWSNLIFQRSLQTDDPVNDKVARYFMAQWSLCDKESPLLAALFERTFSHYPSSAQKALADQLMEAGVLNSIDLLSEVRPHGELQKHLLDKPAVWSAMPGYMLHDNLQLAFDGIVSGLRKGNQEHGAWAPIEGIEEPAERRKVFHDLIVHKLRWAFGFLNDEKPYFETELFHAFLSKLGQSWQIHPANLMYAMLCADPASSRDYDRYETFIAPYANDIRALIQWSDLPRDTRIRNRLPESSTIATIDGITALALSGGAGLVSLFQDMKKMVVSVEHDDEIGQVLGHAFD